MGGKPSENAPQEIGPAQLLQLGIQHAFLAVGRVEPVPDRRTHGQTLTPFLFSSVVTLPWGWPAHKGAVVSLAVSGI